MDDWGSPWADDINKNTADDDKKDKTLNLDATAINPAIPITPQGSVNHHPDRPKHQKKPSIWDSGGLFNEFDEGWGKEEEASKVEEWKVPDVLPLPGAKAEVKETDDAVWKIPDTVEPTPAAKPVAETPWALPSAIPHEADAWGRMDEEPEVKVEQPKAAITEAPVAKAKVVEDLDPWARADEVPSKVEEAIVKTEEPKAKVVEDLDPWARADEVPAKVEETIVKAEEPKTKVAKVLDPWALPDEEIVITPKSPIPVKEAEKEGVNSAPAIEPVLEAPHTSAITTSHDDGWGDEDIGKHTDLPEPISAQEPAERIVDDKKEQVKEPEGDKEVTAEEVEEPVKQDVKVSEKVEDSDEDKDTKDETPEPEQEKSAEPEQIDIEEPEKEKEPEPAPMRLSLFVQPEDLEDNPFQEERGVTPVWNSRPDEANAEDDDDDFGDFGEFDENIDIAPLEPERPKTPPKPEEAPVAHVEHELFIPDTKIVEQLYPALTSYPGPPPRPSEIITTDNNRKAWYRLTREGSLREHMYGADDYVRVSWAKSRVKEDVTKIVAKWITENRNGGSLGNETSNPRTMFGWDDASPSASTKTSMPVKKTINVSGSTRLTPTHSPLAASFGWGDVDAFDPPPASVERSRPGSPLKEVMTPQNTSPRQSVERSRPSSVATMAPPMSRTASLNRSAMSSSPKPVGHGKKKSVAFAGVIPGIRPSTSASLNDKALSAAKGLKEDVQSKRMSLPAAQTKMDDWSIFDTKPTSLTPVAPPISAFSTPPANTSVTTSGGMDDMDAFESFVSSRPSSRATSRPQSSASTRPVSSASTKPQSTVLSDDLSFFDMPATKPAPKVEPPKPESPKKAETEDDWGDDWNDFEDTLSAPPAQPPAPTPAPAAPLQPTLTGSSAPISISGDDWGFFESKATTPAAKPTPPPAASQNNSRSSAPISISNDDWGFLEGPKAAPANKPALPVAQAASNGQLASKSNQSVSVSNDDDWAFLEGRSKKPATQPTMQSMPASIMPMKPTTTTGSTAPISISGDDWSLFDKPTTNPTTNTVPIKPLQPYNAPSASSKPLSFTSAPALTPAPPPPKASQPLQFSNDDWGFFDNKPASTTTKPVVSSINTSNPPVIPKRRSSLSKKDNSGTPFHNASSTVAEDPDDFTDFVTAPATATATKPPINILSNSLADLSSSFSAAPTSDPKPSSNLKDLSSAFSSFSTAPTKPSSNFADLSSAFSTLPISNAKPSSNLANLSSAFSTTASNTVSKSSNLSDLSSAFSTISNSKPSIGRSATLPPLEVPTLSSLRTLSNPLGTPSVPSLQPSTKPDDDDDDDWGEMLTSPTTSSVGFSSLNPSRAASRSGTPAPSLSRQHSGTMAGNMNGTNTGRPMSVPSKSIFARPVSLPPVQKSSTGTAGGEWGDLSFFEDALKPGLKSSAQAPKKPQQQVKKGDWDFLI